VGRQFGFERLAFFAEDVLPGAQRAQGGFFDFRINETFR
jgi:hypothetical protein